MYGRTKRVLLREYLEHDWTKQEVAEKIGVSRRTIHHWIATGQLDRELDGEQVRYGPRPPVEHKIDPYVGIIQSRLGEFPKLSAVRLFDEITAAGYQGGYTQVKEYVREVRPKRAPEPVVRFETDPGKQAQVDFAHFRFPWGVRWCLLVVLGYSRFLWVGFFKRQTMQFLMRGIEQAFLFFGGVPVELLFDQLKSVIVDDRRDNDGPLIENIEFARFANHWGFHIRACKPHRPQTKGKVERPISYIRSSFIYGRHFINDDDLEEQLNRWLDEKANVRIHGTTKEVPALRLERDERACLGALASRPYQGISVPQQPPQTPPVTAKIVVERRPLEVYSQLVGSSI